MIAWVTGKSWGELQPRIMATPQSIIINYCWFRLGLQSWRNSNSFTIDTIHSFKHYLTKLICSIAMNLYIKETWILTLPHSRLWDMVIKRRHSNSTGRPYVTPPLFLTWTNQRSVVSARLVIRVQESVSPPRFSIVRPRGPWRRAVQWQTRPYRERIA